MNDLRIGIPTKGRLGDLSQSLLKEAGLKFRRNHRSLFAKVRDMPVEITFLRTDDIPTLCAEGAIDMGITGCDLVAESGADVQRRLELNEGKCRLSVCIPADSQVTKPSQMDGKRIATSFPNNTKAFFKKHGCEVHVVELSGSVEVMISLGVADAIVDLVETGSTLAANNLKVLCDISQHQAVVVQGKQTPHQKLVDRVIRRLEGVVIARGYSLVEYNVPRTALSKAQEITPGFNSPTINPLEDADWCAVRVMVKRSSVVDVMEKLEAIGASAILETKIGNCRL